MDTKKFIEDAKRYDNFQSISSPCYACTVPRVTYIHSITLCTRKRDNDATRNQNQNRTGLNGWDGGKGMIQASYSLITLVYE
ncbi:hypothetical protein TWF225_003126 [Orbilia oligospora]|uniref:Uncharacterized protein n=1 Tax=Orbilia oligospora TaxID=2813651 RepID=A0A8H2DYM3_ORBOL|nr:hypothetical protein TWF225_003126 [Orbilia oligospora]KAF3234609.1 hypothetical protein TWF217_003577 [Orbilia oligospora]KAF3258502.1 hypothetical protein TWF128_004738 [Orbilia oligospora]TGJ69400.1 hypothetical protein EYR41_005446 [Orbilia oligospora]